MVVNGYRIKPGEVVCLKEVNVAHGDDAMVFSDDLVLTNQRLICVNRSIWGRVKAAYEWPISQIKNYNGVPQATESKLRNGDPAMEVYMSDGTCETFCFGKGQEELVGNWVSAIGSLAAGRMPSGLQEFSGRNGFSGKGGVKGNFSFDVSLGDSSDFDFSSFGPEFEDMLVRCNEGLESVASALDAVRPSEPVSRMCPCCGAQLSGVRGQTVRCDYCGADQVL